MTRPEPGKPETKPRKTEEDILDKQLEDSFPASDPPNLTRAPKDKRDQVQPAENTADRKTPAKK